MLILARKPQESIIIDHKIIVKIIEIKGEQVRIGVEAPEVVQIFRKEVYDSIQRQNVQAAKTKEKIEKEIIDILKNSEKK